jgi:adenylate cyclase class 2
MLPEANHSKPDPTREVEVKLRVEDPQGAAKLLFDHGFRVIHERAFESNVLFDTPERALRAERRLLRVREFGGVATFTYKGTPETGRHKSREELETDVADAETLRLMLGRLGYLPVFRYEKYRTVYQQPGEAVGLAVLDETPIGCWIELEGAPEWIDSNASRLGFTQEQYITESYGALWLSYCREHGIDLKDMVFGFGGKSAT